MKIENLGVREEKKLLAWLYNKVKGLLTSISSLSSVATSGSYEDLTNTPTIPDISGKADKISIVDHGTSDTTFTLTPNVFHVWGQVTSLTLTFDAGENGIVSEYMFEFISGSTPTTLFLPAIVKWQDEPTIESNVKYQVSIVRDVALIVGVSYTS